jgi:hypothetical protein
MTTRFIVALSVASSVGLGLAQFTTAAQNHASQPSVQAAEQAQGMPGMMRMHEQMMAEMKVGDARLDALVKEMNAASGDAKVTAMAAVVNELVSQHKSMHGRMGEMGEMHQRMMGGRGMMMNR